MAVRFSELLSKNTDNVERPKPYPAGHYYGKLGKFTLGDQNQNKTPYVRFPVTAVSPGEDIDPADLEGINLGKKQFRSDFFLTEDAEYRLKEFLKSLGLNVQGRSFGEILPETPGADVYFELTSQPSDREEGVFVNFITNITGVAGMEQKAA